jgi:hypothetical protein
MGPVIKCRVLEVPLCGAFLISCEFALQLLGEYAPRLLRLTAFRLELVTHIPPPQGIPLGCVLDVVKDACTVLCSSRLTFLNHSGWIFVSSLQNDPARKSLGKIGSKTACCVSILQIDRCLPSFPLSWNACQRWQATTMANEGCSSAMVEGPWLCGLQSRTLAGREGGQPLTARAVSPLSAHAVRWSRLRASRRATPSLLGLRRTRPPLRVGHLAWSRCRTTLPGRSTATWGSRAPAVLRRAGLCPPPNTGAGAPQNAGAFCVWRLPPALNSTGLGRCDLGCCALKRACIEPDALSRIPQARLNEASKIAG